MRTMYSLNSFLKPALLAVCFVAVAACNAPLPSGAGVPLEEIPLRRHTAEQEWRDARAVGSNGIINLGKPPANGVLRLGLFAAEPGIARVYAGDALVESVRFNTPYAWHDVRVALPAQHQQEAYRLDLRTLPTAWLAPCEFVAADAPGDVPPNVIVVLVDTLRKDHVGAYGYRRDTTPNIDALARDAVLFAEAVPQSSWTKPSVASLMTSTYPNVHGAQDNPDIMREGLPTLAGVLQSAGYETHMLSTNVNVLPMWGFGRDAFRFVDVDAKQWEKTDDTTLVNRAIDTLAFVQGRPWFLYVHAMGPHDPYNPPTEYARRFLPKKLNADPDTARREETIARYDAEIAYTDAHLGRLFDAMKAQNQYDDALIVLLSDHGEEFWEHGGQYHGTTLYEELLDVPLLIKLPGNQFAGTKVDSLVELVDVAPTVLAALGLNAEPGFEGRSLLPLTKGAQLDARVGYASLVHNRLSLRAAKDNQFKFIHDLVADERELFDLAADPREQRPFELGEVGERFEQHAARIAVRGRDGFHLLMTWAPYHQHSVQGKVTVAGLRDYEFRYQNFDAAVTRDGDTITFAFETDPWKAVEDAGGEEGDRLAFNRFAHVYIEAPPESAMEIDLRLDGAPFPAEVSYAGAPDRPKEFGAALEALSIIGHPNAFDPARLPVGVNAYAWYVPPPDALPADSLDAETRETLRALGYLD